MANELTYVGTVTEGVLKITNRKSFDTDMKSFDGQRLVIKIKKYKPKRSLSQNGYYHSAIIPAVMAGLVDNGFERHSLNNEIVHEMLKEKFLKKDIGNDDGLFITVTQSTADLTKEEFGTYVDAIDRWCITFLGFNLPIPSTQQQINY